MVCGMTARGLQQFLDDSQLEMYRYMVDLKASKLAVRKRMASDGVEASAIDAFVSVYFPQEPFVTHRKSEIVTVASAVPDAARTQKGIALDLASPDLAMFWLMHRQGKSDKAITMRMASGGFPPAVVESFQLALVMFRDGTLHAEPAHQDDAPPAPVMRPASHLTAEGPAQQLPGVIWTVPGLLAPEECQFLIAAAESKGFGSMDAMSRQGRSKRMRTSERSERVQDEQLAAELTQRVIGLAQSLQIPVALSSGERLAVVNPTFRISKVLAGDASMIHVDNSHIVDIETAGDGGVSPLTLFIFLNDAFQGGELSFHQSAVVPAHAVISPLSGCAVVFRHAGVIHEALPVASGTKYVLQSSIVYRSVH